MTIRKRTRALSALLLLAMAPLVFPAPPKKAAATAPSGPEMLPPLREQTEMRQEWLKLRLERVLPALMRKHGVAMWIVVCREYNEDPAWFSLASPWVMHARRRTILLFYDRGGDQGIERLALGGGSNGGLYEIYRDPEASGRELYGQGQWQTLRKVVDERKPKNIALDISQTHAFSDGLSVGEWEQLAAALGPWTAKVVRAEELPLEYIETRIPEMLPTYKKMMAIVHALIARAFSNEVITPGKTTNVDVEWWLRQHVNDLGLGEWFPPSVNIQRPAKGAGTFGATAEHQATVIERGDHLHTDFGIYQMGLATDTQHVGYVLKAGETDAPAGLKQALLNSNRMQDMAVARLKPGLSGNDVLLAVLADMKAAGIEGSMYSHPIGDHGHGAGPMIGLWDRQEPIPGRGEVAVLPNSWYSIELQATTAVPEWNGQRVSSQQEEDVSIDADGKVSWVLERQTRYHLVK